MIKSRHIKISFLALFFMILMFNGYTQYSRQDSLRGSITPQRAWWDLKHYELSVKVSPNEQSIEGQNIITYEVLDLGKVLQLDLQNPMQITSIEQSGQSLLYVREANVYWVFLQKFNPIGSIQKLKINFKGTPTVSERPPWKGGFIWTRDKNDQHFIATSCQREGASLWWPCKDHPYDEPDSMSIAVNVPQPLVAVSNGRLRNKKDLFDNTITFNWVVKNPINGYGVNLNIGNYVNFSEKYEGEKGELDCDYWVLSYNLNEAKKQFKEGRRTLEAFEHWFGPYPFYEDSYKLVEAPYLGMEHQSSVTYGNGFQNGYMGRDLSGSGWGLKFDFIIVHESGHEWFANSITNRDVADMWIHEGFTCYSENLFLEYHFGKKAGSEYVIGLRQNIQNEKPIIAGYYGVNQEGSGDMYYKAANMLHTIRQLVNDDKKWLEILRGLNKEFYHQTVTTKQIEDYINHRTAVDLQPIFDQYLRTTEIPELEIIQKQRKIKYRWVNIDESFTMPIKVNINGQEEFIIPTLDWQKIKSKCSSFIEVDPNFYIEISKRKTFLCCNGGF